MCLIRDLTEHATRQEFVYRHEWRQHDLVIWDNRCVLHARSNFDASEARKLRRVTVDTEPVH
jgi:alpha-ketoglutarate-dependent taurine dioxygenase